MDINKAVDFLNELLTYDADAITKLCLNRVKCNNKLGNHPTVQVIWKSDNDQSVGLLGILNGLFSKQDQYIFAIFDQDEQGNPIKVLDFGVKGAE